MEWDTLAAVTSELSVITTSVKLRSIAIDFYNLLSV